MLAGVWRRTVWVPFVVLCLVFFWEVLFGWAGEYRYFWDDFLEFTYPTRYFAASSIAAGEIPFWNPYVFAGMPFLADIQSAVLYPLNLALNLFVRDGHLGLVAVEALAAVHLMLAGCWMFLLVRRLGASVWGGWAGGITFMFSGFMVTHVIHLNILEVAVWLPLAFLFLHLAFTRCSLVHALAAGAVLAVAFLGGSPQISLLVYIGLGFFTLYMTGNEIRRTGCRVASWLKIPALGAAAVAFSLGLCLFQLLPSYELSRLSIRPELGYQQSVEASFPPWNLITLFIPHFFGGTGGGDFLSYWGVGRYYYFWEMCGYVGIVGLLMAWIGLRKSNRPYRGFLVGLLLISLLMAAGKYGGVHRLFFAVVPGYDRFRIPSRALILLVFSVSVLAGYGADVLVTGGRESLAPWFRRLAWRWAVFLVCVLAAGAVLFHFLGSGKVLRSGAPVDWDFFLSRAVPFMIFGVAGTVLLVLRGRGRLPDTVAGLLVVGLLVADLFVFGRSHNPGAISIERYYAPDSTVEVLKPGEGEPLFRVQTRAPGGVMLMRRNQGEINGVFNVDGYNQLKLSLYKTFDVGRDLKLDLLNVRYRIEQYQGNEFNLVEAPNYLPRVFLVPEARVAGSDEETLEWMKEEGFDPRRTVILQQGRDGSGPWTPGLSRVDVVSYRSNRIEVNARLDGPGILVFSEIYYPSWIAYVDGVRTPVLRADYALRAVRLEPGDHRVVLAYESAAFRNGLMLSGICLLAGIGCIFGRRRSGFQR